MLKIKYTYYYRIANHILRKGRITPIKAICSNIIYPFSQCI